MTASETGREIPADELVERLRIRAAQHKAGWRGVTYGQAEAMDDEAAADLIEAQAARIASLEATGCMCRDVPIGSHKVSVLMDLPEHMADVQDARVLAGLSPQITVDACLVEEVRDLWYKGIRTTGCCCGHNRMAGYIGVEAGDIQAMKAMGYVVRENASRPGAEDSFVPESVRLSASLEAERARTVEAERVIGKLMSLIINVEWWVSNGCSETAREAIKAAREDGWSKMGWRPYLEAKRRALSPLGPSDGANR